MQRLHAQARVAAGGNLYDDLIERAWNAVSSAFSKEDLGSVGLQTDADVKSRIDQLLKAGALWDNAASFSSRYAYFFRLEQATQETVPPKLTSLLSNPNFKSSLAKSLRTMMLSHLAQYAQDPATMTADALKANFEAMSHAAANAIREAKPALVQPGEDVDKLASVCTMHLLRQWIAGGHGGPSMVTTMAILGPHVCRRRLADASHSD